MPPEDDPRDETYWTDHPDNPENAVPCQTCDKTLQKISDEGNGVFWCQVCGTLMERGTKGFVRWTPPKLVDRCRGFESMLHQPDKFVWELQQKWHTGGIREAINVPGNRPPLVPT